MCVCGRNTAHRADAHENCILNSENGDPHRNDDDASGCCGRGGSGGGDSTETKIVSKQQKT